MTLCWTSTSIAGNAVRVRLKAGERAPFAGNLISDDGLAKLITEQQREVKLLELEIEKLRRDNDSERRTADAICTAKLEGEATKLTTYELSWKTQRGIYEVALGKAATSPPWWKSHYVSFAAGALLSGGLCVAAWSYLRTP